MSAIFDLAAPEAPPHAVLPAVRKPSLVGLTRADLAAALAAVDVPERERKMRVAQLWHWIYFQGAQHVRRDAQCLAR